MKFKDYYKIMELEDDASHAQIKKSYRKLARRYHPDVSKLEDAEQKFKELGEAYEVLKDKEKRQEYDQLKAMGAMNTSGQFRPPPGWESATHFSESNTSDKDFSDFFTAMFGQGGNFHRHSDEAHRHSYSMRGEDIHHDLAIFLEDLISGTEKVLALRVPEVDQHGLISHRLKKLKVKIPVGTKNGQLLRIKGQGGEGIGDAGAGDLIVTVKLVPHPLYSVSGSNVTLVVPVSPWEAALGEKISVDTLFGSFKVSIPALSQSGSKFRLKGKGLTGTPAGDLFIVIKIQMPGKETEKSRELFKALSAEVPFNPRASQEKKHA